MSSFPWSLCWGEREREDVKMLWDEAHFALVLTPHAYYTLTDDSNMDTRPNTNTNALTWSM